MTCHVIFPILHLSNNLKEKKRNINIDLAILPSHDRYSKTKERKIETIIKEEEIKKEKSGVRE